MTFEVCVCATTANLVATYNPAGPLPTLTMTATGLLVIDGTSVTLNQTVLVKNQDDPAHNGIYFCTIQGSGGVNCVLTLSPEFSSVYQINSSGIFIVLFGDTQANSAWFVVDFIQDFGDDVFFQQIVFPQGTVDITTVGNISTGTWDAGSVTTPSLNIPVTTSNSVGVIRQNSIPLIHTYNGNFFAGASSGNFSLSGVSNIGLGGFSLQTITSGSGNIAISASLASLTQITSGSYNIAISGGYNYTSSESNNICIGSGGTLGESNVIRIGGLYGTGVSQQTDFYTLQTLHTSGRVEKTTAVTTSTYTVLATDYYIFCTRSGAIAITLMASPETGRTIIIKDNSGAALVNNITITPAAGNIDGAANYVINTNYGSVTLIYNGTQWNIT